MIHNKKPNKKIKKIHEKSLRPVYSDHKTSFSEFLKIGKSVTIHQKNFQYLLVEIYKVKKGISLIIMNENFQIFGAHTQTRNSLTIFFGTESIMNMGAKLWIMIPMNIKPSESLNIFKFKIKY